MKTTEAIIYNLKKVREKSIKVWRSVPESQLHWKPRYESLSCIEIIRHIVEEEYNYLLMFREWGGKDEEPSPFDDRSLTSIEEEILFSMPFHQEFLQRIAMFTESELDVVKIDFDENGNQRTAGEFFLQLALNEAVYIGRLLNYLDMLDINKQAFTSNL